MHLNKKLNTFDSHAFLIIWKANDWMYLSCIQPGSDSKGPTKPDYIRSDPKTHVVGENWLSQLLFVLLCLCLYFLLCLCFFLCLFISSCLYLFPSFFLFSLFTHTQTHTNHRYLLHLDILYVWYLIFSEHLMQKQAALYIFFVFAFAFLFFVLCLIVMFPCFYIYFKYQQILHRLKTEEIWHILFYWKHTELWEFL